MSDASDFVPAIALSEVRKGEMRAVQFGDREVVICHTRGGDVFVLDNICTHAEARMSEGQLRGDSLICPMHGARFDVRDGRAFSGAAIVPLRTYLARVIDGIVEISL